MMTRENSNTGLWALILMFTIFCLGALSMVYVNISKAPIPATISQDVGEPAVDAPVVEQTVPNAPTDVVVTASVQTITYTVVQGDTLWSIAERSLGDAHRWTEVWSENQAQIDNPDLIFPGQVLTITVIEKSTSASPDISADPPSVDPDQGSLDDIGSELPAGSNPLLRELRPDQLPRS